jgi:hypothetical protein
MRPGRLVVIVASLIALALAGIRLPRGILSELGAQRVSGQCTVNFPTDITCGTAGDTQSFIGDYSNYISGGSGNDSIVSSGNIGDDRFNHLDGFFAGPGNDTLINNGTIIGLIGMLDQAPGAPGDLNPDLLINNGSIRSNAVGMDGGTSDTLINNGTIYSDNIGMGCTISSSGCRIESAAGSSVNANVGIVGGYGPDVIEVRGTINANINADDGNDSLGIYGSGFVYQNINMGPGNDTVDNFNRVFNVFLGEGDDSLYNDYGDETIANNVTGGPGNDTIYNRGSISGLVSLGDGADSLLNSGYNSTTSNHALINNGVFGEGGNDTIINSLHAYISGIDGGTGDDSIRNHSLVAGVLEGGAGNDNVTNFAGALANYIGGSGGNDSLSNGGALNSSIRGGVGQDTVTNFAGGVVSWLNGDEDNDRVLNGGFVNADLNGGTGNDSVVNLGGAFVSQIYGDAGLDTVVNGGFLNGTAWGGDDNDIVVNLGGAQATNISGDFGNDSVFNGGYLVGLLYGGFGNDTVVNAAYSYSAGADLGDGNDQFINGGYLNGNITCGAGADQVSLVSPSYMAGSISCGSGNDTVYLLGGTVIGLIDGGADSDAITFQFTYTGTPAQIAAIQAAFAVANPAGGTITIGAQTFTWTNFEFLYNFMNFINAEPGTIITITINRRVNAGDAAAPVAIYCEAGGVDLWTIDSSGSGSFAASIPYADVNAGTSVTVSGVTFTSSAGGAFTVTATGHDGKPYAFTGSCS